MLRLKSCYSSCFSSSVAENRSYMWPWWARLLKTTALKGDQQLEQAMLRLTPLMTNSKRSKMLTTQSASGRWLEKKKYITLYYIYGNPEQECKAAISGCQAYLFCRSMVFSGAMEHKKGPRKTISIYTDLKTVEIILLIEKGIHMDTPKSHRTMNNSLSSFSHIFPCQNHHF